MKKRKIKRVRKYFFNPIYKYGVWFMSGYPCDEVHRWLLKKYPDERFEPLRNEDTGGTWSNGDNRPSIIWIKKYNDYYTIVHEVVHLVLDLMHWKKIPIEAKNSETIAYLVEYYTEEFWREISKL